MVPMGSTGSYLIATAVFASHRGNSAANRPYCRSQQFSHCHSTNHATPSKLTLLRRPPAIHSFPPPSCRPQQIQPFPQSGAGVCPHNLKRHVVRQHCSKESATPIFVVQIASPRQSRREAFRFNSSLRMPFIRLHAIIPQPLLPEAHVSKVIARHSVFNATLR